MEKLSKPQQCGVLVHMVLHDVENDIRRLHAVSRGEYVALRGIKPELSADDRAALHSKLQQCIEQLSAVQRCIEMQ
jgi:hypothetical protein